MWKTELEPVQNQAVQSQDSQTQQELQRLKITIKYDDPADGFEYTTYRLYSPSLNMSAEKMKEVASDPVKMRAMGSSSEGLSNLLSMISELPGGDKITEALTRGGVPAMLGLLNKVISGDFTPEELMSALGSEVKEEDSLGAKMVKAGSGEKTLESWTDYDTAGIGEKPGTGTELASADKSAQELSGTGNGVVVLPDRIDDAIALILGLAGSAAIPAEKNA
jgi:hypothetical protein